MRYTQLGCRYRGIPHNLKTIYEDLRIIWERCLICQKKFRWNKGYRARINNIEYLKVHVRNFAQKTGPTKRIYQKVYNPEKTTIVL